ncbi:unnamed protein product [Tuber aestivum]|uniref:Uncharacterized protein n=1 Tax=Tuber aestivum TaxID=59557 RepID=A0A292PKS8_9PEZI|nr:unnamed protein product [Tuber aestivum]
MTLSLPSISINGLDAPADVHPFLHSSSSSFSTAGGGGEEEFEAYDRKLHDRVSALYAELERETLRVAQLRREAPGRARRAFEEALRSEGEGDERILRELGRKRGEEGVGQVGDLGVRELERGEEVARGYEEGVGMLMGLQSKLPAIAHKLTRAHDALDYVEPERTTGS